ncbi:vasopressin V1a receptor-like [Argopecten irradians]|uniref:vasopressin V1a receptor-like n=1 Tax=Argopecten irradians TaxID=31199 RepID=UPI0037148E91
MRYALNTELRSGRISRLTSMEANESFDTEAGRLYEWNSSISSSLLPNNIILGLYLTIGLLGNLSVLYVYIFKMENKKDVRYFIPVLAVTDAIASLAGCGVSLLTNIYPVMFPVAGLCECLWFFACVVLIWSGLLNLVIAYQRYMKICRLGKNMTLGFRRKTLVITGTVSTVLSLPSWAFFARVPVFNYKTNVTGNRCGSRYATDLTFKALIYIYQGINGMLSLVIVIGIIVFYSSVGSTLYKQENRLKRHVSSKVPASPSRKSADVAPWRESLDIPINGQSKGMTKNDLIVRDSNTIEAPKTETCRLTEELGKHDSLSSNLEREPSSKSQAARYRVTYMFMTLALAYILCLVPTFAVNLSKDIESNEFWMNFNNDEAYSLAIMFCLRLHLLNNVMNPFIYFTFDKHFRREVIKLSCFNRCFRYRR